MSQNAGKCTISHLDLEYFPGVTGKCTISHLALENVPGVTPQTPIEAGLKLLAHQGLWESSQFFI